MRVKRYIVDSMPDALQMIRSELGKDAVILNTKEVRSGGLFGWFSKKKIEVIAAIDGSQAAKAVQPPRPVHAPAPKPTPSPLASDEQPVPRGVKELGAVKAYAGTAAASGGRQQQRQSAERTAVATIRELHQEEQSAVVDPTPRHATAASSPNDTKAANSVDSSQQLLEEIKQMKEMVVRLSRGQAQLGSNIPEALAELESALQAHEVDQAHIDTLMNKVLEVAGDKAEQLEPETAREILKSEIRNSFSSERVQGIQSDTKVVHFVGPTGVGKTTTIAKLAAEQVLKHRRKVGFITSDTYRIAAVEQLKTYATILNVPLEVVFSPHELNRAFAQLQDRDVIFMDTAGRNFRNEMYVSELNSLLTSSGKSETYLVLSLTTRYRDMKVITDNFSRFKLDKVLFTKRDETETFGALLNLAMDYPLEFSYITDGQNVPDDISLIDVEEWMERILEVNTHE